MEYAYQYWQGTQHGGLGFTGPYLLVETGLLDAGEIPSTTEELLRKQLCEKLFNTHNVDERPNGRRIRSMSVGDLIVLEQPGYHGHFVYRADIVGFKKGAGTEPEFGDQIGWLEAEANNRVALPVRGSGEYV